MQLLVILVIVALVLLVVLVHMAVAVIAAHMVIFLVAVCAGLPAVGAILIAVARGMHKHTVVVFQPQVTAAPRRRELPPAAEPQPVRPRPKNKNPDPWSSGEAAWEAMVEQEDRAELEKPGPREARAPEATAKALCEAPRCSSELDEYAWELDVRGEDGLQVHRFCSGECAQEWQDADRAARQSLP